MSTSPLTFRGSPVPITLSLSLPASENADTLISDICAFQPFSEWISKIEENHKFWTLKSVDIQSVDRFGKRIGFLKFRADVRRLHEEGKGEESGSSPLPGIVFMRGGAVGILLLISSTENPSEKLALLTRQARVPIGNPHVVEIPAGMLDGSGHFTGVAAKEIEEETGIVVEKERLVDLTALAFGENDPRVYPSCGGSDEFIRLFVYESPPLSPSALSTLTSQIYGCTEENEHISLRLVKLGDLWRETRDMKTLSALYLYERLMKEGKL